MQQQFGKSWGLKEGLKQMLKDKKRGYIGKEGKTGVPLHLDESVDPSGRLGVVGVKQPTRLTKPLFAATEVRFFYCAS